jgi:hypothetical protein
MVIIWGTTHAGKVDEVPGLFHVVTQFGHLYYLPLIPTGSYIVLEKMPDGGFRGASIPLSFKSWLVAWLRAGCVVTIIAAVIIGIIAIAESHKQPLGWIAPAITLVLAAIGLTLSYRLQFIRRASYERAKHLAERVGLNDMGLLMIEVAYGRLTAAEADARLAQIDQQAMEAEVIDAEGTQV